MALNVGYTKSVMQLLPTRRALTLSKILPKSKRSLRSFHTQPPNPRPQCVRTEPAPWQTLLVKSKFSPKNDNFQRFNRTGKWPGLKRRAVTGPRIIPIHDVYYDNMGGDMMNEDIFVRKRSDAWELDIRLCHDLAITASMQVRGLEDCQTTLNAIKLKNVSRCRNIESFYEMTEMRTIRKQWLIEDFTVAVDHTFIAVKPHPFYSGGRVSTRGALHIPHVIGTVMPNECVKAEDVHVRVTEMAEKIEEFKRIHKDVFQDKYRTKPVRINDEIETWRWAHHTVQNMELGSRGCFMHNLEDWTLDPDADVRVALSDKGWEEDFSFE